MIVIIMCVLLVIFLGIIGFLVHSNIKLRDKPNCTKLEAQRSVEKAKTEHTIDLLRKDLSEKIALLKTTNRDKSKIEEQLKSTLDKLRAANHSKKLCEALNHKDESCDEAIRSIFQQKEALQQELDTANKKIEALTASEKACEAKLATQIIQNNRCTDSLAASELQQKSCKFSLQTATKELEKLREKENSCQKSLGSATEEKLKLTSVNKELESSLCEIRNDYIEINKERIETIAKLNSITKEVDKVKTELTKAQQSDSTKTDQITKLYHTISQMQNYKGYYIKSKATGKYLVISGGKWTLNAQSAMFSLNEKNQILDFHTQQKILSHLSNQAKISDDESDSEWKTCHYEKKYIYYGEYTQIAMRTESGGIAFKSTIPNDEPFEWILVEICKC